MQLLAVPHSIDYSALTNPVSRADVRAFRAATRAAGKNWGAGTASQIATVGCAFLVFGVVFVGFLSTVVISVVSAVQAGSGIDTLTPLAFPTAFIAFIVIVFVAAFRTLVGGHRWETWMRLSRFAATNHLQFSPADSSPNYPGAIFTAGHSAMALDHLRSTTDRFFDMGNYRYVTGSGKNASTHNWGFLAFNLDRTLPNIVLDSKANNGLFGSTNLPQTFARDQILHLEGDFDKYFTLYCPKEYERDALYIFTPDLMALLIDAAAPFDVEIVDNWMFVYSAKPFVSADPAVYQRLFRIIDSVGAKALQQTDRYTDEHAGSVSANFVAPQGRRLRRGVSAGAIVFVVIFAVFWAGPWVASLFGN